MGRVLVVFFLFVNLILCFYVTYELFRTADYLADVFKILAVGGLKPPDFIELKALGVYVFLLGMSGFALAYWVYEDGKNIDKLVRSRKFFMRRKTEATPLIEAHEEIQLLECPECGEELEEGFEVCPKCGYELKPITCPKCGKEIFRKFNFCPYCGNKTREE
ncbi:MAG: zinc ribbon domain-containing protein [Candidatus Bathyarchaeia archaeon]